ncbi:alpha-tocopherol transfer protein-like [Condylostylus longicornis]|uniref:alpha-tocopherol transfer protein-like n=1 Tax=Condylostylus longicornis TaxID=2530218 RepID=UPI00244DADDF|nr:alpha-tocopherol transfer protein-like [Condylostylus longicornis]
MVIYKNFDEALPHLDAWLKTQPHLPIIEKNVKERFLKICDLDMDKTKKLIDTNYTIRNSYPNLFMERDLNSSTMQSLLDVLDFVVLEKLDAYGNRVGLCRLGDPDPDKFLYTELTKLFLMYTDAHTASSEIANIGNGEVIIFDMKGFTLKHLSKYNFTTLKAFLRFATEGISSKIIAVHMINCPTYIDKILAILKPFISAELFKLLHFHQPNSETLYEFIEKSILPNEYGGNGGTMEELKQREVEILKSKRDYLMDPKYWKINDDKRPKNQPKNYEMEGQFRQLCID